MEAEERMDNSTAAIEAEDSAEADSAEAAEDGPRQRPDTAESMRTEDMVPSPIEAVMMVGESAVDRAEVDIKMEAESPASLMFDSGGLLDVPI